MQLQEGEAPEADDGGGGDQRRDLRAEAEALDVVGEVRGDGGPVVGFVARKVALGGYPDEFFPRNVDNLQRAIQTTLSVAAITA